MFKTGLPERHLNWSREMNRDRAEGRRCFYEDMVLGTDVVGEKRAKARIKSTSEPKEKPVTPGKGWSWGRSMDSVGSANGGALQGGAEESA